MKRTILITFIAAFISIGTFTVNADNSAEDYEVFQRAGIITQAGIGGFAILADFGGDAPGDIFASRTTYNVPLSYTMPFIPHSSVSVIDPQGNRAAFYDFTDVADGRTDTVLNVPYAMEGIWQIRFVSGRNGDWGEIGINGADSWGIRGECVLGVTDTTPHTGYIYVPDKVSSVYLGSTSGDGFSLTDENGNILAVPEQTSRVSARYECTAENLQSGVYTLNLDEDYSGGIMADIAPSLICPTPQMAQQLRGGWEEADGILCQGVLQKQARKELLRLISEKNLNVEFEKPVYKSVNDLKYPMAEAQLFGVYGAITPLYDQLIRQNLNPVSPYCGTFAPDDTPTWEGGIFSLKYSGAFSELVNMDAQLNAFYKNEALITRTALSILGSAVMLSEDFLIREGGDCGGYAPTTHGNFAFKTISNSYANIREYLDEETVLILDKVFLCLAEKQGNYRGQGPTNQWFFTTNALVAAYKATRQQHIYNMVSHHAEAIAGGAGDTLKGQSAAGYFIEGLGCDGDYHSLSQNLLFSAYKNLKEIDQNDANVALLKTVIDKNLEFDSLFYLPQPKGLDRIGPNNFTARKTNLYGIMTHATYPIIMDEFPLAKRRWEINNMPETGTGPAGTFPYYVNSIEWAERMFSQWYARYDKGKTGYSSDGDINIYNAYKNIDNAESAVLPCEEDFGIWDKPGIIAVKNKGLYMNIFYSVSEGNVPAMAFMGGGITELWSEGTGAGIVSKKHDDYSSLTSADQIKATCIFGKKTDGSFFVSGKEKAYLTWIEPEKEFEIGGIVTGCPSVLWNYSLTDTGIIMTVSYSGSLTDAWVNVPIPNSLGARIARVGNSVYYCFGKSAIELCTDNEFELVEVDEVTCVRVKLGDDKKAAVSMRCIDKEVYDGIFLNGFRLIENIGSEACETMIFTPEGGLRAVETTVLNCGESDVNAEFIYAMYDKDEKLIGTSTVSARLRAESRTAVAIGILNNAKSIRLMIWDSDRALKPMCTNILTEVYEE